jgi:hypothetical protein
MKHPTYSPHLGNETTFSVEAALRNEEVEEVISRLRKNTGARGFLDQEIAGVEL